MEILTEPDVPLAFVYAPTVSSTRDVHTPPIQPLVMPAMDYKTYAEQTHNAYLLSAVEHFKDHVIVFSGAGGLKVDAVDRDHRMILSAAGMRNPARAVSTRDTFNSEFFPLVGYSVIPRAELHTCMREADIREHTSIIELRRDLNQQLRARAEELAEGRKAGGRSS